jgi:hypothetical protein
MADKDFVVKNSLTVNTIFTANGTKLALGANVVATTSNLTIGNSTVNSSVTNALITVGNASASANLTPVDLKVGATTVNTVGLTSGNSTANIIANSTTVQLANASNTSTFNPVSLTIGTTVVNTSTISVGNSTAFVTTNSSVLVISQLTALQANLTVGTPGQVLYSNGTTPYWNTPLGVVNLDAQYVWSNTQTFSNNLVVGNSTINTNISNTSVTVSNSTANATISRTLIQISNTTNTANLTAIGLTIGTSVVNTTSLAAGANIIANTTAYYAGNSTANVVANSTAVRVSTAAANSNLSASALTIGDSVVNTSSVAVGGNVYMTTTRYFAGNSTANVTANSTLIQAANATGTANITPTSLTIGTSSVGAATIAAGANVTLSTTTLSIGNTTQNVVSNSTAIVVGNSTVNGTITTNSTVAYFTGTSALALGLVGGSTIPASYVQNTDSRVLSGNLNFTAVNNYFSSIVYVGANVYANATTLFVGNSTVNSSYTSTLLQVTDASVTANLTSSSLNIGANVVTNTSTYFVGNTTYYTTTNSSSIKLANVSSNTIIDPRGVSVITDQMPMINLATTSTGAVVRPQVYFYTTNGTNSSQLFGGLSWVSTLIGAAATQTAQIYTSGLNSNTAGYLDMRFVLSGQSGNGNFYFSTSNGGLYVNSSSTSYSSMDKYGQITSYWSNNSTNIINNLSLINYTDVNNISSAIYMQKGRATSGATGFSSINGDILGKINFRGSASDTGAYDSAIISSYQDAAYTVGDTSIAGRLVFITANTTSNYERMRIASNGNIGIANTTSAHTLSINGNTFIGNSTQNVAISGAALNIQTNATNYDVQIVCNVASTGGLGPFYNVVRNSLAVAIPTNHGGVFWTTTNNSVTYNTTKIYAAGSAQQDLYINSAGSIRFATNAAAQEVLSITNTYNVGINNTAPTHNLSVNGNAFVNTALTVGNNGIGTGIAISAYSNTNSAIYGRSNTQAAIYGQSVSGPGVQGISTSQYGIYGTSTTGYGAWGSSIDAIGVYGTSNTSSAIRANANTGIGLEVISNTGTVATFSNATTTFASVYANGNIGFGNSTPSYKLTIQNNANGGGQLYIYNSNTGTATGSGIGFGHALADLSSSSSTMYYGSDKNMYYNVTGDSQHFIQTAGTTRLAIGTGGVSGAAAVAVMPTLSVGTLSVNYVGPAISAYNQQQNSIFGQTYGGTGVFGQSNTGTGVYGSSNSGIGVGGYSNWNMGLYGTSNNLHGVWGVTSNTNMYGVVGVAYGNSSVSSGTGVGAFSNSSTALYAQSNTGNLALFANASGIQITLTNSGEIRAAADITAYYSSDINLKENIKEIPNALDKVSQIRGVTFDWTKAYIESKGEQDDYFNRKHDVGVIAQEIQAVLPEAVAKRENGTLAVKYERIVPLLIEAIKELKAEIEQLKGN